MNTTFAEITLSDAIFSLIPDAEFVIYNERGNLRNPNIPRDYSSVEINWYNGDTIIGVTTNGPVSLQQIIDEKHRLEQELPLKILTERVEQEITKTNSIIIQNIEDSIINNNPIGISTLWLNYRKQLRELPSVTVDPSNPTLEKPTNAALNAELNQIANGPKWKEFLLSLTQTVVFQNVRQLSRVNVESNAIATELRTSLGEAALGFPEVSIIQSLFDELIPALSQQELNEIDTLIESNNIPITMNVGIGTT